MKNKGFSRDVCRSMIAMLDQDRSGMLNYSEFEKLWTSIRTWKVFSHSICQLSVIHSHFQLIVPQGLFKKYDKNNSGTLSGFELRQALESAGYNLNNHILNILMHRYGNKEREIDFDDFMMCAVKLKTMIGK